MLDECVERESHGDGHIKNNNLHEAAVVVRMVGQIYRAGQRAWCIISKNHGGTNHALYLIQGGCRRPWTSARTLSATRAQYQR